MKINAMNDAQGSDPSQATGDGISAGLDQAEVSFPLIYVRPNDQLVG